MCYETNTWQFIQKHLQFTSVVIPMNDFLRTEIKLCIFERRFGNRKEEKSVNLQEVVDFCIGYAV